MERGGQRIELIPKVPWATVTSPDSGSVKSPMACVRQPSGTWPYTRKEQWYGLPCLRP